MCYFQGLQNGYSSCWIDFYAASFIYTWTLNCIERLCCISQYNRALHKRAIILLFFFCIDSSRFSHPSQARLLVDDVY